MNQLFKNDLRLRLEQQLNGIAGCQEWQGPCENCDPSLKDCLFLADAVALLNGDMSNLQTEDGRIIVWVD